MNCYGIFCFMAFCMSSAIETECCGHHCETQALTRCPNNTLIYCCDRDMHAVATVPLHGTSQLIDLRHMLAKGKHTSIEMQSIEAVVLSVSGLSELKRSLWHLQSTFFMINASIGHYGLAALFRHYADFSCCASYLLFKSGFSP